MACNVLDASEAAFDARRTTKERPAMNMAAMHCAPGVREVEQRLTAVMKAQVPVDMVAQARRTLSAKVADFARRRSLAAKGETVVLWRAPVDGFLYMECGVLVDRGFGIAGDIAPSRLPAGRAVSLVAEPQADGLTTAWSHLFAWSAAEGLALSGINWEIEERTSAYPAASRIQLFALLA